MADTAIHVPGHRLLPYEVRHIQKILAKRSVSDAEASRTDAAILSSAAAANTYVFRNIAMVVMVVAFAMAAITRAHGGPIDANGSPTAWEWILIVVWWLLIAIGLVFLVLAFLRAWQAIRAARRARPQPHDQG